MKNIQERAKEWSEHIVETTPYDVVNGKVCVFAKDRDIADVAEESYIAGAKDQKAIDDAERQYKQGYHDAVEKAYNWLKKELRKLAMSELKDNFLENEFKVVLSFQVSDWLTDFRKAMEE